MDAGGSVPLTDVSHSSYVEVLQKAGSHHSAILWAAQEVSISLKVRGPQRSGLGEFPIRIQKTISFGVRLFQDFANLSCQIHGCERFVQE